MRDENSPRLALARSASGDELEAFVHETDEQTLVALLENPHLEEPHVCQLLDRLDLPASVLTGVASEGKWTSSEGIRLRLARHPRTPRRISFALLRQLYLFDLVRVSLLPSAPAEIRRVADEIIITRVPHIPVGQKLTLARRGSARVAGALLAEGHPQAMKLALDNAFLSESQVLKVVAKPGLPERVVVAIARHPKWAHQYNVRVALARNMHTPSAVVRTILPNLTLRDLKDIVTMESLAPHLRKIIRQELSRRTGAGSEGER
ncbi:MAG: hypothetical protein ACRD5M_13445 [Candidatus Acidiferrales bacterium]